MSVAEPEPVSKRFPIWLTAREALTLMFRRPATFLKAGTVPFILTFGLIFAYPYALQVTGAVSPWIGRPAFFLISIVFLIPFVLFAVSWHRFILLPPAQGTPRWKPAWVARHWRFLVYLAVIDLILFGEGIQFSDTDWFLSLLANTLPEYWFVLWGVPAAILVLVYLSFRLSFIFPAIALSLAYGLWRSWRETRGQGMRMLAAWLLATVPLFGILMIASLWEISSDIDCQLRVVEPQTETGTTTAIVSANQCAGSAWSILGFGVSFISYLLIFMIEAVSVSIVSIAFRTCTGWVPGVSTPPVESSASD